MKLYEIMQELTEVEEAFEKHCLENEGEITDFDLEKRLDDLRVAREEKLLNIGCWIKNLKAEADALGNEANKLSQRKKYADNKAESLKQYLYYALRKPTEKEKGETLKDNRCQLGWRKSESIEIDLEDFTKLPEHFQKVKIEPDKKALKEELKSGGEVENVTLIEKQNLQIK